MSKIIMKKLRVIVPILLMSAVLTGCISNPYKDGMESLENGKYEEAAEQFEKAIEKDKNKADSYRGLGMALWESEDYKGAKKAFEHALKEGAEKTGTLYNFLGVCELRAGEADKAMSYFEKGLKDKENSEKLTQEMRFNYIAAVEKTGDMDTAKSLLSEYVSDYPDDEEAVKEAEFLETR